MSAVISIENVSKRYQLGVIGTETLKGDVSRLWARLRGKPDPLSKIDAKKLDSATDKFVWALKNVDLRVNNGDVLGIIGGNGAGKSTLLKILSRITAPTAGTVKVKGQIASLLEVGTGFHPDLTGRENIYLNGAIHGLTRIEIDRKLDEIIDFSGVEEYIDTPVKRYSSGMYVRLGFAVAAHLEPDILIVDEVLAVGDIAFQKKCLGKMGDVARQGRTVLFVSHNMNSIRSLCHTALLMQAGKIVSQGNTEEIIYEYLAMSNDQYNRPKIHFKTDDGDENVAPISLGFLDQHGQPKTLFHTNEPFLVDLKFQILRRLPKFMAFVGVVNEMQTPIVTHWSKILDAKPGKYQVRFRFNIPLASSELKFNVGFSSNENYMRKLNNIFGISITDAEILEQPYRSSHAGLLIGHQDSTIELLD